VWSLQGVRRFSENQICTLLIVTRLAPNYEKLAKLYTKDYSDKVVIAKIDATANDVPDEIAGFPTIKLYPAGAKDSPVEYSGSRTIEDLANFVRDSGKYKVDAYVPEDEDTVMDDASAADQETLVKAAPAATEEPSGAAEAVKSAVSEAADAVKSVVADGEDDMAEHDEL
jgi:protein disulfide-isomerase A1